MCKPQAAKPLTVDSARCPRTIRSGNRSITRTRWRQRGVRNVRLALLCQQVCAKAGRRAKPSVGIIDSQPVKTVSKGAVRI